MKLPRQVYRCDKVTMEIVNVYPGVNAAAKAANTRSVQTSCNHRRVSSDRYIWRYADDYDPNESFEGKYNRPVACIDAINNTITFYDTLAKAEKALFLGSGTVTRALRKDSLVLGRYKFKYAR